MSAFNRLKRGLDDAYKHRKKIKGAAQSIGHYINEVKRTATQLQKVRDMDAMTLGGTPVHRRLSISSTGSRTPTSSRTPSSGRKSGLSVLSAPSTRIPSKIVKKGNRRLKGTKHVKVSKLFKAKVKECSSANHVYGYFQANFKARILNQPVTNKTYIDDLAMSPSSLNGSLFSFANVLHAASRLWNGKAANATPKFDDAGSLDNKTSVINVRRQWCTMRFKNNSTRTIRAKHFLCTPKSQQSLFTANQAWYQGITDMIANTRLIGTPTVTQNHLFTHPKTVDQFNQYFTSSETDYTLEPGQSIEENIEGPSMLYDAGKFWYSGNYCVHQKQDIYSFVVYWYDLCVGLVPTVNLVGYINEASGSTDGLLVQSTYHCQLNMPEPVGWISTGVVPAAGPVQLTNRQKRFCYDEFNTDNTAETAVDREDEQNPT